MLTGSSIPTRDGAPGRGGRAARSTTPSNRGAFDGPEAAAAHGRAYSIRDVGAPAARGHRGHIWDVSRNGGLLKAKAELEEGLAGVEWTMETYEELGTHPGGTATCRGTGRESGAPFEITVGHLWELRDGRVVRWVVVQDARGGAGGRRALAGGHHDHRHGATRCSSLCGVEPRIAPFSGLSPGADHDEAGVVALASDRSAAARPLLDELDLGVHAGRVRLRPAPRR